MSYTERMRTLPSFKKVLFFIKIKIKIKFFKKQVIEVNKPVYLSSRRDRRNRYRKFRDENNYRRRSKDRERNEFISKKNRYESERKKSYIIEDGRYFEKFVFDIFIVNILVILSTEVIKKRLKKKFLLIMCLEGQEAFHQVDVQYQVLQKLQHHNPH